MNKIISALVLSTGIAIAPAAFADDKPPANAKPLSEIVKSVESQGFSPILDIGFDDRDGWEIKTYRNNEKRELKVNPVSGEITSNRVYKKD